MKKEYSILGLNILVMFCYQIILFSIWALNKHGNGNEVFFIIALLLIQATYNLIRGIICFVNRNNQIGWQYIGSMFAVLTIGFPLCFVGGLTINPWN